MGGSSSRDECDLGPLPQQQIIAMQNGQPAHAPQVAPGVTGRVGTSMKGTAVRAPLRLLQIHSRANGVIELEVSANVSGVAHLLAPAVEAARAAESVVDLDDASSNANSQAAMWPVVQPEGTKVSTAIGSGDRSKICFDQPGGAYLAESRNSRIEPLGNGMRRWPVVIVIVPASPSVSQHDLPQNPPDGTLMLCCVVERGELKVARQLIAWGGAGAAYVLKELYGIQEAKASGTASTLSTEGIGDNQAQCVVCLTSPKDTALMPCGHFCVCYECGVSIRLSPARNRCPLCRADVSDILHIDVAVPADVSATEEPVAPSSVPVATASGTESQTSPNVSPSTVAAGDSPPSSGVVSLGTSPVDMDQVRAARLERLQGTGAPQRAQGDVSAPPDSANSTSLPPKCLQRLTREMRQVGEKREQHLAEHGVSISLADPAGEDLRVWTLTVLSAKVDADTELGKQLRARNVPEIELEVWIPDLFPVSPPKVRVLRPSFQTGSFFVQSHGALCLEILTKQGWTPAMSLLQLGVQIKMMMSQGTGSVSSASALGGKREAAWATAQHIEDVHADWKRFNLA